MKKNDQLPFSYPVKVGHVSGNPLSVRIAANEQELEALARAWDVLSVDLLEAELDINRWKRDGVRVKGQFRAKLSQACIVTLDPVEETVEDKFEQLFVPENSKLARRPANDEGELFLDPDGPDLPETFSGDTIDVGDIVAELVALAINPYPRKEGATFDDHVEDDGTADKRPSPFASLKDWQKE